MLVYIFFYFLDNNQIAESHYIDMINGETNFSTSVGTKNIRYCKHGREKQQAPPAKGSLLVSKGWVKFGSNPSKIRWPLPSMAVMIVVIIRLVHGPMEGWRINLTILFYVPKTIFVLALPEYGIWIVLTWYLAPFSRSSCFFFLKDKTSHFPPLYTVEPTHAPTHPPTHPPSAFLIFRVR